MIRFYLIFIFILGLVTSSNAAVSAVGSWQHSYPATSITEPAGSSGDWLVFVCSWNDTSSTPTASDPTNGSWTATSVIRDVISTTSMRAFYFQNAAAASVVVSLSLSPTDSGCSGGRFSGVATSSSVRSSPTTDFIGVASTTYTSGSSITATTGDLILIFWANETNDLGTPLVPPATGYTTLQWDSTHFDAQFGNTSATSGTQTPAFTTSGSGVTNWVMTVMNVAIAGGGSTPAPRRRSSTY